MCLQGNAMDPMQQMQKLREARSRFSKGQGWVSAQGIETGSTEKEALRSTRVEHPYRLCWQTLA